MINDADAEGLAEMSFGAGLGQPGTVIMVTLGTGIGKRLNKYLAFMEKLFWPDLFIIGGGISKESEKYLPLLTIDTPVIPAQFLNEAGIVGAALAVRKNEIEPSD